MIALALKIFRLSGRDIDVESLKAIVPRSSMELLTLFILIIWGLGVVLF